MNEEVMWLFTLMLLKYISLFVRAIPHLVQIMRLPLLCVRVCSC